MSASSLFFFFFLQSETSRAEFRGSNHDHVEGATRRRPLCSRSASATRLSPGHAVDLRREIRRRGIRWSGRTISGCSRRRGVMWFLTLAFARTDGGMTFSGPKAWRGSIKEARIFPHFLHSAMPPGKLARALPTASDPAATP